MNKKDLSAYAAWLERVLESSVSAVIEVSNEITIIAEPSKVYSLLFFLKKTTNCQFKELIDIVVVDYPEREKRFEVNYLLLSLRFATRLKIKTRVDAFEGLESVTPLFKAANWFEREAWDLFGVFFNNHPNLRRILTDYGFEGHPLRKDFPLTGFVEVRYDEEKKRVVCENLETAQDFRAFEFQSPWNEKIQAQLLSSSSSKSKGN
jgi:NADH/F420H2 dehydrogenase subunit C